MTAEEGINVRLACADRRVRRVGVSSSRRPLPARLVRGRSRGEVERVVPLLFSLCRRAQGAAAAAALAAAHGDESPAARLTLDVTLETLQESVWRLLIDWPHAIGEAPRVPAVASVRRAADAVIDRGASLDALLDVAEAALHEHVYGIPAAEWLAAADVAALDRWIEAGATPPARLLRRLRDDTPGLGRSDVALLPSTTRSGLLAALVAAMDADAEFGRLPYWNGAPAETGALARQAATPLIAALVQRDGRTASTRFVARLVELAALARDLRTRTDGPVPMVHAHAVADGVGLGLAETARGLLLHRAEVRDGVVAAYRIVAPTEWNFHPDGPLARGLAGRAADDRAGLEREARIVVQSLDPCVACRVEIADA